MHIDFSPSQRSRLGIEWELACVDRRSGELSPAAPELLARLGAMPGFPHVTTELLTNTIELVTAPHHRVSDAVTDLTGMVERVSGVAEPLGVDLISSGTHPFSQWFQQQVTPGKPRYDTLIDRTRWWGRQMMIWGVHVHVAVEDRRKVFPIIDGLLTYLPHFQALSASSPFWAGENTGYASNRALMFQQLPTAGLPPRFTEWAAYEAMVADLRHVGVIEELNELRWDIRPSPRGGPPWPRWPRRWAARPSWPPCGRSSTAARATSASSGWPRPTTAASRPWCRRWSGSCAKAPPGPRTRTARSGRNSSSDR